MEFIEQLGMEDDDTSVAKPTPLKPRNAPRRDFAKPWAMILGGASDALWKYLLWYQTFAVNESLTFSAVPFDKMLQSWVIMTISGDAVKETDIAKRKALSAIKSVLWVNKDFRAFADRACAFNKIAGSAAERAYHATSSFDLTYVDTCDAKGDHAPIWQLTGKPLVLDPAQHARYLHIIRSQDYFVGLHPLLIGKRHLDCSWCKSTMHPAHKCPFPLIKDWHGPCPDNVECFNKRMEANDGGRGKPAGRGRRGKPNDDRGWTKVQRRGGRP